jgi:transposase
MKRQNPKKLVFIDESAANTKMGRSHAWVRRGQELVDPRPMNWGTSLTMIGAIRLKGWVCLRTLSGAAKKTSFFSWFTRRLLPKLRAGDIVILDNAQVHKDPRILQAAKSRRVKIKFLPPYSPDFNPIEPAWAVIKKQIKAQAPRQTATLKRVAHRARRRVTPRHARAWFKHCGYRC